MAKYTDEQIKQALAEMSDEYTENFSSCVLDLIKRQEAEIEALRPFGTQVEVSKKIEKEIKSEAIKELMFNLNGDISAYSNAGHDLDVYAWLQNYAKKWVGEGE